MDLNLKGVNFNYKAIILGIIVSLSLSTFLDVLVISLLCGFIVGLWMADKYLEGAINGIISMTITSFVYFPVLLLIYYPTMFALQPMETSLLWIICILLGGLGAILGVFIRKMIIMIQDMRIASKLKGKRYLLCDKCGGYHQLKDDEDPEDYSECECGSKLEYQKPLEAKPELSDKKNIQMRILAITIGVIIDLIFLAPIAGFVTSYMAKGDYKDGIINSALAVSIGGFLLALGEFLGLPFLETMSISEFAIGLTLDIISGIIGGIIGIYIKNRRRDKGIMEGVVVCDNCKEYYELPPDKTAEDFNPVCECGGKINPAKKTSLILLTIGYIFSILGGFIGLFIGLYLYTHKNPNGKFHGRNMIIIVAINMVISILMIIIFPDIVYQLI